MNKQEIFNTAVKHLRIQNAKSINKFYNQCKYYGDGGRKCAIGCLISDEEYNQNGKSWMLL